MSRRHRQSGRAVARSAGIVLGSVQKLDQQHHFIREYHIQAHAVADEVAKFKQAIGQAVASLQREKEALAAWDKSGDLMPVLQAHEMMLQDPELFRQTEHFICREHINAEWALKKSITAIMQVFEQIEDTYLRSRKADVEQVGQRIFEQLAGEDTPRRYEHAIMVAWSFSPADIVNMWQAGVSGFISIQGGENSHAMIVARGVGLPGLAGVSELFEHIEDGDTLLLDAERGEWILHPNDADIAAFEQARQSLQSEEASLRHLVDKPSVTADGYALPLMANIEFLEEVQVVSGCGADGIGLFRTEFLFMRDEAFPDEAAQYTYYRQVVQGMQGKPVTFRLLDIAADKLAEHHRLQAWFDGKNPALGLRGVRMLLQEQDVLRTQLRAMIRAGAGANISILVPMVTQVEEMTAVRRVLDEVCKDTGVCADIALGCMIEVPAAVFVADALAHVSDFFSIGSNDLLQYSLAVDRTDDHVSYLYDEHHPAVVRLIEMAAQAAHRHGIPVAICGELAANTDWLHQFLTMRITSLSMSARHILQVRRVLRGMTAG